MSFGLGLAVTKVTNGFSVRDIAPGGPAELDGKLEINDVITSVDGTDVTHFENIARFIRGPPGSSVELGVRKKDGTTSKIIIQRAGPASLSNASGGNFVSATPSSSISSSSISNNNNNNNGSSSTVLKTAIANPRPMSARIPLTSNTPASLHTYIPMTSSIGSEEILRKLQSLESLLESSTSALLKRMEVLDHEMHQRLAKIEQQVQQVREATTEAYHSPPPAAAAAAQQQQQQQREENASTVPSLPPQQHQQALSRPMTSLEDAAVLIFSEMRPSLRSSVEEVEEIVKKHIDTPKKSSAPKTHFKLQNLPKILKSLLLANGIAYNLTPDDEALIAQSLDLKGDGTIPISELVAAWKEWQRGPIQPGRSALVVVDMQNDFLIGTLVVNGGVDLIPGINALRRRVHFDLIVHTADAHPPNHVSFAQSHHGKNVHDIVQLDGDRGSQVLWPVHCVKDTEGAKLYSNLLVEDTDIIVPKGTRVDVDAYSGFFDNSNSSETELRRILREHGITDVYVCGVAYDFCVGSTAIDAVSCGFNSVLIRDLSAEVGPETADDMTDRLLSHGVIIAQAEEIPIANMGSKKPNSLRQRFQAKK